ncbi:dATP/dGTP diphosphohydrolase domain-containing protein [Streptomyces sp. NPDC052042]|uniref:dATP/dGTP diphosphohydrolase domain-containing protein n=1 Tax=Streptomyces sp. NPDC052042 TaxID=3365683 RepID=UPI0037D1CC9C
MTVTAFDTTPYENTTPYETKDPGRRDQYASGMLSQPATGRPRFDLIVPENVPYDEQLLTCCAALMTSGAEKYTRYGECTCSEGEKDAGQHLPGCPALTISTRGERNWEKADSQAELDRMKASAFRHFMQWLTGETDEDHAAAVVFNLLAAESTAYAIGQRRTAVGNDRAQDPAR